MKFYLLDLELEYKKQNPKVVKYVTEMCGSDPKNITEYSNGEKVVEIDIKDIAELGTPEVLFACLDVCKDENPMIRKFACRQILRLEKYATHHVNRLAIQGMHEYLAEMITEKRLVTAYHDLVLNTPSDNGEYWVTYAANAACVKKINSKILAVIHRTAIAQGTYERDRYIKKYKRFWHSKSAKQRVIDEATAMGDIKEQEEIESMTKDFLREIKRMK